MTNRWFYVPLIALVIIGVLSGVSCDRLRNVKGKISGTVYMDGRPVSGHVLVKDVNGGVVAQADTNMNGHYIIADLNAGTYNLQYLNMQGVPFGNQTTVVVRLGRFEVIDLQLKSTDRLPMDQYGTQ